jgi:type IV pilus assembly protein PilM
MSFAIGERVRVALAPPEYLLPPLAGIDVSTSGIKVAHLVRGARGLMLAGYAKVKLAPGVFTDGEIVNRDMVAEALVAAAAEAGISIAHVSLSESKSYLFETAVPGNEKVEWRTAIEQHLDEFVPLPPAETVFDFVPIGRTDRGDMMVSGVGFAERIVEQTLAVFDQAHIGVQSLEGEMFASSRALLPTGDETTVLIIDIGKTTTKLSIVTKRVPRFATTITIGGHALTLAVQKYFGVTEAEARRVKADKGIVPTPGNEEYLAAMLSTVSAIRDEISRRLEYWQERAIPGGTHEKVSHALLVGGNASVRGLPEYLEGALKIPVAVGNVFTNCASMDIWVPSLDYTESLAFATSIGLALRECTSSYA